MADKCTLLNLSDRGDKTVITPLPKSVYTLSVTKDIIHIQGVPKKCNERLKAPKVFILELQLKLVSFKYFRIPFQ